MPDTRAISELRNNSKEKLEFCHKIYAKLAEAEAEIANGNTGEDFFEVARKLRGIIHAKE